MPNRLRTQLMMSLASLLNCSRRWDQGRWATCCEHTGSFSTASILIYGNKGTVTLQRSVPTVLGTHAGGCQGVGSLTVRHAPAVATSLHIAPMVLPAKGRGTTCRIKVCILHHKPKTQCHNVQGARKSAGVAAQRGGTGRDPLPASGGSAQTRRCCRRWQCK